MPIVLTTSDNSLVHSYALADSGGSATAFMDFKFAVAHRFHFIKLQRPIVLNVVDGRTISSGKITHYVEAPMRISLHQEKLIFPITSLGHYPVVLGIKWLQRHDVGTRWGSNMAAFNSTYCKSNCLPPGRTVMVPGMVDVPETPSHLINETALAPVEPAPIPKKKSRPRSPHSRKAQRQKAKEKRMEESVPDKALEKDQTPAKPISINMIGAVAYGRYSKKRDHQLFALSLRDIDKASEVKKHIDPATLLPGEYHDFLDVFSKDNSDVLAPYRPYDYDIPLHPGRQPPALPLRNMSRDELLVVKKYLEEHLSKGWIRASRSPAAAPVLLVKKPGGGIRFCVDYRGLNEITIKNRYPLPLIKETLDRLSQAKFYTKLDIISAFNKMRIKE